MSMTLKGQATSACGNGKKCLKECPTNVKEAIDWIICLAGKNGCNCQEKQPKADDPNECVKKVAKAVWNILIKAAGSGATSEVWSWNELDITNNPALISDQEKGGNYVKDLIDELGKNLGSFIGCIKCTQKPSGTCPLKGVCGLFDGSYTYSYKSASECCIKSNEVHQQICAKILVGCMPLIFSALTYLYWNCCDKVSDAKWKDCTLTSGSTGSLSAYLVTLGYDTEQIKKCNGSDIKRFLDCFKELPDCLAGKTTTDQLSQKPESYTGFVDNIQNSFNGTEQGKEAEKNLEKGKQIPLQRLYMGASFYFKACQAKYNEKVDKAKRPTTICELLYWLLGLPYTTVGMDLENRSLGELLSMEDEDSETAGGCDYLPLKKCCTTSTNSECPMTPANADPYLLPPCYYSAFVLLSIQGQLVSGKTNTVQTPSSSGEGVGQQNTSNGGSNRKESGPFLHDLYTNQHFNFYYPSSIRSWAAMVWDVLYALYFQLGFLYKQCKVDYATGYGWKDCAYGKGVTYYESQTWICTTSPSKAGQHDECGKGTNRYSPLQCYLCDDLTDFRCKQKDEESATKSASESDSKSYCTHLDHLPPSQWCPIPMGFADNMGKFTPDRKGVHLSEILALYFEDNTKGSSLYQLLLFVSIVSVRPPRSLGDMFAFFSGIGGLCDTKPPQQDKSLDVLLKATIKGYPGAASPENIIKTLKTLAGSCKDGTSPTDTCVSLCSLSPPDGSKCNTKYLCSLSWSIYTVFATRHIECYLSWVVYMIDYFECSLKKFLKDLEDVDCKSGCSGCRNDQTCHKVTDTAKCQCKVVECKRILGTLYSFGFTYQDTASLKSGNSKTCTDFLQQLKNVAEGTSLEALIKAVNQTLYSIRLAFIFWAWLLWTAAIVYLVFGLVVDLDILHIRSHIWLKHTHNIPAFNLFAARRLKYGIQVYFGR